MLYRNHHDHSFDQFLYKLLDKLCDVLNYTFLLLGKH